MLHRAGTAAEPSHRGGRLRVRLDVDGPARFRRDDDEAVGVARFRRAAGHQRLAVQGAVERAAHGAEVARLEPGFASLIGARRQLNDAAERAVAVNVARGAADDVDALQRGHRHAVPVDPRAERVVQRDVVGDDERAAGARRRHAAQRHPLRRRVGDGGRRAAEEAEAGNGSQLIVEPERRRFDDRGAIERRRCVDGQPRGADSALTVICFGNRLRTQLDDDGRGRQRDPRRSVAKPCASTRATPVTPATRTDHAVGRRSRFSRVVPAVAVTTAPCIGAPDAS